MYAVLESGVKEQAMSNFDTQVESNLRLRNEEIRRLMMLLEGVDAESDDGNALQREKSAVVAAAILTLYAHWEGFSKYLMQQYVRTVGVLGIELQFINRDLLSFHFDRRLQLMKSGELKIKKVEFAQLIDELRAGGGFLRLDGTIRDPKISTGSNLWTVRLRSMVNECAIETDILSDEFRRHNGNLFRFSHSDASIVADEALYPENGDGMLLRLPEVDGHREPAFESPIDWLVGARNRLGHGDVVMRSPDYGLDAIVVRQLRDIVSSWSDVLVTTFQQALTDGKFLAFPFREKWIAV